MPRDLSYRAYDRTTDWSYIPVRLVIAALLLTAGILKALDLVQHLTTTCYPGSGQTLPQGCQSPPPNTSPGGCVGCSEGAVIEGTRVNKVKPYFSDCPFDPNEE